MVLMMGQAVYQLIEVDVADESGHVTKESARLLHAAEELAENARNLDVQEEPA